MPAPFTLHQRGKSILVTPFFFEKRLTSTKKSPTVCQLQPPPEALQGVRAPRRQVHHRPRQLLRPREGELHLVRRQVRLHLRHERHQVLRLVRQVGEIEAGRAGISFWHFDLLGEYTVGSHFFSWLGKHCIYCNCVCWVARVSFHS